MEAVRHRDLPDFPAMPRAAVGLGYTYVHKGETPKGMDRAAFRRTMVG